MGLDRADTVNIVDEAVNMSKIDSTILDAANGIPQLDSEGNLVGPIILRIGTVAEINIIVLSEGEIAYCTDTYELRKGDGSTSGGITEVKTQAISADNFTITHNGAKIVQITTNSATDYTSDATTPIQAGLYDGQQLRIILSVNTSSDIVTIQKAGTASYIKGAWLVTNVGSMMDLSWSASLSKWLETIRAVGYNTDSGSGAASVGGVGIENTALYATSLGGKDIDNKGDYSASVGGNSLTMVSAISEHIISLGVRSSFIIAKGANVGLLNVDGCWINNDNVIVINAKDSATDHDYMMYTGSGKFSAAGDAQLEFGYHILGATTDATETKLYAANSSDNKLTVASGVAYAFDITILGSTSGCVKVMRFKRSGIIANASGTTGLVGAVDTIGTDLGGEGWTVSITAADGADDCLDISVTGGASDAIKWSCEVKLVKVKA